MKQTIRETLLMAAGAAALVAAPAAAQSPATAEDGEWLSLSGTVLTVSGDDFVLDYGKSDITVEMDDFDFDDENIVTVGDEVTVTGRMDVQFFQTRRLEARSVYVESLHTRFFVNPADEEDYLPEADGAIVPDAVVALRGNVKSIQGDRMVLDTKVQDYVVDAGSLNYDPFDVGGIQYVEVGDRVSVTGRFDDSDFFDNPEIDATSIIELR